MKKVIIALERTKFNYLYKYDFCHVSGNSVIKLSYQQILDAVKPESSLLVDLIEYSLPIFEQEHEVLLVEVDAAKIGLDFRINFDAVIQIISLNDLAEKLLRSRLSGNLKFARPLPYNFYEAIKLRREDKIRKSTAEKVLAIFDLPEPNDQFKQLVRKVVGRKVMEKRIQHSSISLDYLVDFDTTPSGIPEGNIESFIKLVCVGMVKATGSTDKLRSSLLYNLLLDNASYLNEGSIFQSYKKFEQLVESNQQKFEVFDKTINDGMAHSHPYLLFYLFFSFKKKLTNREFKLRALRNDIQEGKVNFETAISEAVYLISYTLSMGVLFESIQQPQPILSHQVEDKETQDDEIKEYLQVERTAEDIQAQSVTFKGTKDPQGDLFEEDHSDIM